MHENCVFFPNARCNMPNSSLFQHVVFQTPSIWRKTIPEHLRMDDACRMHNLGKTFSNADEISESKPYCVGTICPHNLSRCCSFTHLDAMTSLNLPLLPLLKHIQSLSQCMPDQSFASWQTTASLCTSHLHLDVHETYCSRTDSTHDWFYRSKSLWNENKRKWWPNINKY